MQCLDLRLSQCFSINKNIRAMKTIKKLTEKEVVLNRLTQSMLVIYLLNDNANTRTDDTPRLTGNL